VRMEPVKPVSVEVKVPMVRHGDVPCLVSRAAPAGVPLLLRDGVAKGRNAMEGGKPQIC